MSTYTTTPPGTVTPPAVTTTSPGSSAPASVTGTAPARTTPPAPSATGPAASTPATRTTTPAVELPFDRSINSLPSMPASFSPAFTELSGTGPTLKTLNASGADATAGRIVTGIVAGELKNYQVRAGADAESLPGVVHPANFDAINNAVVFVSC